MLDHYVAFKARPGQEQALSAVLDRFVRGLSGQLNCVLDVSAGANINRSGLGQGYTHGCHVRLTDAESLHGTYWNHPAHQRLLDEIDAVCAERFAVDFTRET
jgi:Stress responsive A/B Barrel Domain